MTKRTDWRKTCAELIENVRYLIDCVDRDCFDPVALMECRKHLSQTRAALAQPEPEGVGLSDEEVLDLADDCGLKMQDITTWDGESRAVDHGWECTDAQLVTFATALITRYARPTIKPEVPAPMSADTLAAIIREVDGTHRLGAAALAEAILAHPAAINAQPAPVPVPEPEGVTDRELGAFFVEKGLLYATESTYALASVTRNVHGQVLARAFREALTRYARPTTEPVPVTERFEFSVFNSEYEEQAGGTAPTYAQALSEGQHYLSQYSQDGPHSLEIRRVELLPHNTLPVPGAEVG
jgi:hypothetical protein